jgi:hypothetical protein
VRPIPSELTYTNHVATQANIMDLRMPHLDDAAMLTLYNSADLKLDDRSVQPSFYVSSSGSAGTPGGGFVVASTTTIGASLGPSPLDPTADSQPGNVRLNRSQSLTIGPSTGAFVYTYTYQPRDPVLHRRDPFVTQQQGVFSWDPTAHVLNISGIVFVDGNLHFDGPVYYQGWGTLATTGTIDIKGQLRPVLLDSFPAVNSLGLVSGYAGGQADDKSVLITGTATSAIPCDAQVAAAIFGRKGIQMGDGTTFSGTLVGNRLAFPQSTKATVRSHPLLSTFLPPGMPGDDRVVQVDSFLDLPIRN